VSQGTLIGIDQLVLGATAACDLTDLDGRVAISTGTTITPKLLDCIKAAGIVGLIAGRTDFVSHHVAPRRPSLDVISSRIPEMRRLSGISDPLAPSTRKLAREVLDIAFTGIADGSVLKIDSLQAVADSILHSIELAETAPLPHPREKIETIKDQLIDSAVDMAVHLGWHLRRFNQSRDLVRDATLGGLLHDSGLMLVTRGIVECPKALSYAERQEIRRHPYLGLRALLPLGKKLPKTAQDVILLHHEREDGKGYPLMKSGGTIPLVARLAHIMDVYIALTSPRPFRPAYSPHKAIEILLRDSGKSFDRDTLREFISQTGRYPRGSTVVLSTNEIGVVVGQGKGGPLKPIVDVYFSNRHNFSHTPQRVDLGRDQLRYVRQVML
jgi:hypothetical protein